MMFKLWHKLVLTIVGITGVVLLFALYISNQSVKSGFLAYLNQIEENRIDRISERLTESYRTEGSWEFIKGNKRLWRHYNRPIRTPDRSKKKAPKEHLQRLGVRSGEHEGVRRHRSPHRPPPEHLRKHAISQDSLYKNDENMERPFKHRRPRRGHKRASRKLTLLDENKQLLVGGHKETSEAVFKAVMLDDKVIAYLRFEPFNKVTEGLDRQFIEHQSRAFIKIALLALGIILIGTALFATYLRRRINRIGDHARLLTSGDFSSQRVDQSQDEIGQLSEKLQLLGKTLDDNRQSRRRWISDISHELRTPVSVLQGEIEAIQDGVRKMDQESIESLHQETLRLSRLVEDLHELSLSDIGALNYVKAPLNIVPLIEEVLVQRKPQFDSKDIKVAFSSNEAELCINADKLRLEQLFTNLSNNSQHYTSEKGQVKINIKQHGDHVRIEWSDSEPGVSDDELKKLFERLYRVESSRNRNQGGSGLGLSICRSIVEAHEGSIEAQQSSLGGILFVITFPILRH